MFRSKHPKIDISIPRKALEAIFDECDRHDIDETGGRIIGMYKKKGRDYAVDVLGVIGPGPNARRSPTSFFQDGEYQERVFRTVQRDHPNLEHLGNWHTHHVNGLQTLSGGDRETYHATVNHHKENTAKEGPTYSITIPRPCEAAARVLSHYRDRTFRSARQAVWQLHKDIDE